MESAQFQVHAELERTHWWFTARREIIRCLIDALVPGSKDQLLVEVGCGTGGNIAEFAAAYSCVGIDISTAAIERAIELYPGQRFVLGEAAKDIEDELTNASVVLLLDVLEHVRDDYRLLSDIVSSARPGCYFILTVPAEARLWSKHDTSHGHFRRYDIERFQDTWTGLPVSLVLCSAFNTRLYWPVRCVRYLNRRLGRTFGSAGTDLKRPWTPINWLLHKTFVGEAKYLLQLLARSRSSNHRRGVSLVAVLRKEEGLTPVERKSSTYHNDESFDVTQSPGI